MKKKVLLMWGAFVLCVAITVGLWFAMNKAELSYEEVNVKVLSAVTKRLKNKKNGNYYDFYEIKVEYNGETYDLENAHNTYQYSEGRTVKAYLANDKLYANVEGVKTSTPVATIYFVFLFASFGMLFVAATYTGKLSQKKLEEKEATKKEIEKNLNEIKEEQENTKEEKKTPKKTTKKSTKKKD